MAATSTMVELGTPAPAFELPDPTGRTLSLADLAGDAAGGRPVLVAFVCNHCPYVRHIAVGFGRVASELQQAGVAVVAINSNDSGAHPDDAPERMVERAAEWGWDFPYLVDADQVVARAYRAACTPDFFLYDSDGELAYRGQFDSSRPSNDLPVDGSDLLDAVRSLSDGEEIPRQIPSMGCGIKWRPGNEPDWAG